MAPALESPRSCARPSCPKGLQDPMEFRPRRSGTRDTVCRSCQAADGRARTSLRVATVKAARQVASCVALVPDRGAQLALVAQLDPPMAVAEAWADCLWPNGWQHDADKRAAVQRYAVREATARGYVEFRRPRLHPESRPTPVQTVAWPAGLTTMAAPDSDTRWTSRRKKAHKRVRVA